MTINSSIFAEHCCVASNANNHINTGHYVPSDLGDAARPSAGYVCRYNQI